MKGKKGITLIALVITIIVLLILAGVTIATLTGDNGLLQKATDAKQENEEAREFELVQLAVSSAQIAGEGKLDIINLKEELKLNFDDKEIDDNLKPVSDYWIYKGYKINNNGIVEPLQYQKVEYIESTGTQYINTGVTPKGELYNVEFDFQVTNPINQTWFFGLDMSFECGILDGSFYQGSGATYSQNNSLTARTTAKLNKKVTCDRSFLLFARDYDGNEIYYQPASMKLYSATIKANGETIRKFIPCYRISDKQACLYDEIEEKFYTNLGTGDFSCGPEV